MSPKSFIQFHQEGRKILGVQVRCLDTGDKQETGNRPGPRGGSTRGGPPKNKASNCSHTNRLTEHIVTEMACKFGVLPCINAAKRQFSLLWKDPGHFRIDPNLIYQFLHRHLCVLPEMNQY